METAKTKSRVTRRTPDGEMVEVIVEPTLKERAADLVHRAAVALAVLRASLTAKFEMTAGALTIAIDFGKRVKSRNWIMGFGPSLIPPLTTVTIQGQPQVSFKGKKLIMTGDIDDLVIQGLFVGQKSQLPTFASPIALSTFSHEVLDNEIDMDVCDAALFITWQIQNTSDEPRTFSASIIGDAVLK